MSNVFNLYVLNQTEGMEIYKFLDADKEIDKLFDMTKCYIYHIFWTKCKGEILVNG